MNALIALLFLCAVVAGIQGTRGSREVGHHHTDTGTAAHHEDDAA